MRVLSKKDLEKAQIYKYRLRSIIFRKTWEFILHFFMFSLQNKRQPTILPWRRANNCTGTFQDTVFRTAGRCPIWYFDETWKNCKTNKKFQRRAIVFLIYLHFSHRRMSLNWVCCPFSAVSVDGAVRDCSQIVNW